jgi:hypothetical protein
MPIAAEIIVSPREKKAKPGHLAGLRTERRVSE